MQVYIRRQLKHASQWNKTLLILLILINVCKKLYVILNKDFMYASCMLPYSSIKATLSSLNKLIGLYLAQGE